MSQTEPPRETWEIKGIAKDRVIPRGSLRIPMPAGAKLPPPPPPDAAKPDADSRH